MFQMAKLSKTVKNAQILLKINRDLEKEELCLKTAK